MQSKPMWSCVMMLCALCALGCQAEREVEQAVPNRDIKAVMEAHVDELMAIPGVTIVGIGATDEGVPCLKIYVVEQTEETTRRIPERLEGHPVVIEVSGEIEPMGKDD